MPPSAAERPSRVHETWSSRRTAEHAQKTHVSELSMSRRSAHFAHSRSAHGRRDKDSKAMTHPHLARATCPALPETSRSPATTTSTTSLPHVLYIKSSGTMTANGISITTLTKINISLSKARNNATGAIVTCANTTTTTNITTDPQHQHRSPPASSPAGLAAVRFAVHPVLALAPHALALHAQSAPRGRRSRAPLFPHLHRAQGRVLQPIYHEEPLLRPDHQPAAAQLHARQSGAHSLRRGPLASHAKPSRLAREALSPHTRSPLASHALCRAHTRKIQLRKSARVHACALMLHHVDASAVRMGSQPRAHEC
eukprot:2392706-Pleurochrysis_carterae.AAC.1